MRKRDLISAVLLILAALMPIAHMMVYRAFMEPWGEPYAVGMTISTIATACCLGGFSDYVQKRYR